MYLVLLILSSCYRNLINNTFGERYKQAHKLYLYN